jgi:hypothetical protein
LGDLDVDGRILLKWILKEQDLRVELTEDKVQWRSAVNTVMNIWFHKGREFLDQLTYYQFLKNECVAWNESDVDCRPWHSTALRLLALNEAIFV